jgi:hypothetical protein
VDLTRATPEKRLDTATEDNSRLEALGSTDGRRIAELVGGIKVRGHGKTRVLTCNYCARSVKRSILPHLRTAHPTVWNQIREHSLRLYTNGIGSKRIMNEFLNRLISWTVIEHEIRRLAEETNTPLVVRNAKPIRKWQPEDFQLQKTTVWSFAKRGNWAVHSNDYRGNWAPEIPRNLLLQYSEEHDWILDPFVGGGTTLIEAWLLSRNAIGFDISQHAVETTKYRVEKMMRAVRGTLKPYPSVEVIVRKGDARDLAAVHELTHGEPISMICTHPPYADAFQYTDNEPSDLSRIHKTDEFCREMKRAAEQLFTVLKPLGICALLMGDIRRKGRIVPLGFEVFSIFRDAGFLPEEIIIKEQHQDKSTEFYFRNSSRLRYRIAHEYLFVFSKPAANYESSADYGPAKAAKRRGNG